MQTKTNERSLPKGWQWVKFGDVIAESQPGFASGQRDSNGVIQLRMNNVDTRGNLLWDEFIRVPADKAAIEKYKLKPGDIVFNNTNSTELVGKSALFNNHGEAIVYSNHFTRLRVKPDVADPSFVTQWLISQWQAKTFEKICNRWIGQSAVKTDKLFVLEIPLPPLDEQRRIASRLNEQLAAVESARKAAEEQLHVAWELPSAYLRDVFESEEAMKWNKVRLGDLASSGPSNGIFKRRHEFGRGTPLINVSDLFRTMAIDLSELERVETNSKELAHYGVKSGDLFFCRSSIKREGVGWCAYLSKLPEPAVFDSHVMRLTPDKSRVLTEYIAYYWQLPQVRKAVIENAKTATMTTMNQSDLIKVEIPLAPIIEQKRIVQYLSDKFAQTESAVNNLEFQLAEIESLPASLLREGFAGKL